MLKKRLKHLVAALHNLKLGSDNLSSALCGAEREFFITHILSNVIAPPFRIGTGDITDYQGNKSGQCDIVIEYGNSISLPMLLGTTKRLYLTEGVCAVIEVKSNISNQKIKLRKHSESISKLVRLKPQTYMGIGEFPLQLPYFIISYKGPKKQKTLKKSLDEIPCAEAILTISPLRYIEKSKQIYCDENALFQFLIKINNLTSGMIASKPNYQKYCTKN